jgi:hypothetical protein
MSGAGAYEPLRQAHREVDGQREPGAHRNYEALRQTQQEVDARGPAAARPQEQPAANPYENIDERREANSAELQAKVDSGRISQSEKAYRERQFEFSKSDDTIKYDRLQEARERMEAAKAQQSRELQREMTNDRER